MRHTVLRRLALASAAVMLLAAAPSIEPVGRTRMSLRLPASTPAGSIILIPGGTTLQRIHADGTGSNAGNFVMRIGGALVDAGFAVAFLEDPSDLRAPIARLRAVARPVFLLATSNGTIVAARNAVALGTDGPDGMVLTSTVSRPSGAARFTVGDLPLGRIRAPVLFVHNTNDGCFVSPPAGIAGLIRNFPAGADVTRIDVTSPTTPNDPCGAFAPHGYFGIEDEVTAKIVAWMRERSAPRP